MVKRAFKRNIGLRWKENWKGRSEGSNFKNGYNQ
jgi:hypothetical protein